MALLNNSKKRSRFLNLLNHDFEFDPSTAFTPKGHTHNSDDLLKTLRSLDVDAHCYVIADQSEYDGRETDLNTATDLLFENHWGTLLICPPKPIIVYKREASSELLFLRKKV